MKNYTTCFVTGQPNPLPYSIGRLPILLTQEAAAHYILRTKKDAELQKLDQEIREADAKIRSLADEQIDSLLNVEEESSTPDAFVALTAQANLLRRDADRKVLSVKHTERCVEILHGLKKDFDLTNRLTN